MKKSIKDIILIIVFLGMITLPQIIFYFTDKESSEISTTENRELKSKPEFSFDTIETYPKDFEDYYNDHLPFRSDLREAWTNINFELFKTTVDDDVIFGKGGWLFFRGDKTIEQTQGILEYTEQDMKNIQASLQKNVDKFAKLGIDTYVLILPNKENIYREYLPKSITIKEAETRVEKLVKYMRENSDIKVVYPKEEILNLKEKYQVYRKYDTHWNEIGALAGTVALQKAIDFNFEYDLNSIEVNEKQEKDKNDLATFASLQDKLYENILEVTNFKSDISFEKKENDIYTECISNSENDKTVLVVGDSFRTNLVTHFSKLYKKVVFMHRDKYDVNIIDEVKPDIVVIEAVERYSDTLTKEL